ncbi:sigma factor [Sorangium sp. So ce124]|uniref:sigma factor n=1 Tax=Sorangium sp. So ce124 TaxID=3133280 RepID=UPI003F5FEC2B
MQPTDASTCRPRGAHPGAPFFVAPVDSDTCFRAWIIWTGMDVTTWASADGAAPWQLGSDRFRRLARAMRVPSQDIDDVVQEAWLRVLENHARLGLARDAVAYADQIVRNEARASRDRGARLIASQETER